MCPFTQNFLNKYLMKVFKSNSNSELLLKQICSYKKKFYSLLGNLIFKKNFAAVFESNFAKKNCQECQVKYLEFISENKFK